MLATKLILKKIVVNALALLFSIRFVNKAIKKMGVVLLFHDVSDIPSEYTRQTNTYITKTTFVTAIDFIIQNFSLVSDSEKPECLITFDDGYISSGCFAYNYLIEKDIPFVLFLNSSVVSGEPNSSALVAWFASSDKRRTDWTNSRPVDFKTLNKKMVLLGLENEFRTFQGEYLDSANLTQILNSKLVEIGSHLDNHWYQPSLTQEETKVAVDKSIIWLQKYQNRITKLALPHGVLDESILNFLNREFPKISDLYYGKFNKVINNFRIHSRISINADFAKPQEIKGLIVLNLIRNLFGHIMHKPKFFFFNKT